MKSALEDNINNHKKAYSQFYTANTLAEIMLQSIPLPYKIRSAIDLGMGEGALLNKITSYSPNAQLFGCDIDKLNIEKSKKTLENKIKTLHIDSTQEELFERLGKNNFDLVIGNPPFQKIDTNEYLNSLIKDFGIIHNYKKVQTELIFLILGLKLLSRTGTLCYIVPDGIITNIKFKEFRAFLSTNYNIISIIELKRNSFKGTEAKTHIITINKLRKTNKIQLSSNHKNNKTLEISYSNFIKRGDYSYHNKAMLLDSKPIKDYNPIILRGKHSNVELENNKEEYIHTSSFYFSYTEFSNNRKSHATDKHAIKGDIVIPRVGSRVIGRVGIIKKGIFLISDCIIIIRCSEPELTKSVLATLKSEFGINWIKSISKGVGARHITMADLNELPIRHKG